jgi:glutamyl-tRNA synthetase
MTVRARFAPSPSGALHLGNARTALLAFLDARSLGGAFILRMDDLDPQRSLAEAAASILEDLRWLGLDWDEGPDVDGQYGPYLESQRDALYREAVDRLLKQGRAFECTCSRADLARAANAPHAGDDGPRYPGTCRGGATQPARLRSARLRVEPGAVRFDDLIHGPQSFDVCAEVGDFVIRRGDGVAAYQLAVAVDDAAMGITRVIRGDDLLSSTPRQLLVYEALGLRAPVFGHVPLMVGSDGHRLAKRGGSLTLQALRALGVPPERVVGFLARSAGLRVPESITAKELVGAFSIDQIGRDAAVVSEAAVAALESSRLSP